MNWLAKPITLIVSFLCITLTITSCKKEGDFNLGNVPATSFGMIFTDTLTLLNETILLNDSLLSANPVYFSFGGYKDPAATGKTLSEAYTSLTILQSKDYSGASIDSAILYVSYSYAYGDTLAGQDFSVHQITTQLDGSVPYQTSTNFVTYDPTISGSINNYKAEPNKKKVMRIPLTNNFASDLLNAADDRNNVDFNSNFYGIVIKSNNDNIGSIINANFTVVNPLYQTPGTRLTVYYKKGNVSDTSLFILNSNTPCFNRAITDRSGTPLSSLSSNGDNLSDAALNNKCYIQAGTGIVTKVRMPYLSNFGVIDGSSIVINRAILIMPIDQASQPNIYKTVSEIGLLELNPDNTYKYRNGQLAYIQSNTTNNAGRYYNQVTFANPYNGEADYRLDITRHIQLLVSGRYPNDGFIINPYQNSYFLNRAVLNGSNAANNKMRLEIYYTKVK